jgi:hypothetical protein
MVTTGGTVYRAIVVNVIMRPFTRLYQRSVYVMSHMGSEGTHFSSRGRFYGFILEYT